jgi:hypothetical protein
MIPHETSNGSRRTRPLQPGALRTPAERLAVRRFVVVASYNNKPLLTDQ